MLSIIICSRSTTLQNVFVENISKTVGVDYEIIPIDNSENLYSIFSAYNAGYEKSKYPYLCFVHEDVIFYTPNWGEKVITHLQNTETGIIGLAGVDLVTRVPAVWSSIFNPLMNVIQSDKNGKEPTIHVQKPPSYNELRHSTITLDGVFLCMRRELMLKIHFDQNLKGFHGYDYDITMQAVMQGYQNYVIYNILIEHLSRGKTDIHYFRNLIQIFKKFENHLPIIGNSVTQKERDDIMETEQKMLYKLIKKMVRKGFDVEEIKSEIIYFANIINFKRAARFLRIRIFFIRLFNVPKHLKKGF
ncbi:MAG: glycosyltransferase [Paludibacter sp.]|nr:glycosyltransferase [Paludibacter sp.]